MSLFRRFAIPLLIVVILTVIGVILFGLPKEQTPAQLPTIRYAQFKVYDPVYIAHDLGIFEKHGVHVDFIGDTLAGPTAIQAVAAGKADAALSSPPALLNAAAAGLPIRAVADVQSALPNQSLEWYFTRADSPIKTIYDLKGKTIAVNLWKSSFHYTLLMALQHSGIAETDVKFVLLPFDKQEDALAKGDVDLIGLMEPYANHARQTHPRDFRVLFVDKDVFGARQISAIFVNSVWAKDHPTEAQAFVAAIAEATQYVEAHQRESAAIVARYTKFDINVIPDYHFQPNGRVMVEDFAFYLDFLRQRGDITATWLTAEEVATNEYNPYK